MHKTCNQACSRTRGLIRVLNNLSQQIYFGLLYIIKGRINLLEISLVHSTWQKFGDLKTKMCMEYRKVHYILYKEIYFIFEKTQPLMEIAI